MKILIFGSFDRSLTVFRGPLIKALVTRGHDVIASAPEITQPVAAELSKIGAEAHSISLSRTGTNPLADLRYLYVLTKFIRAERPDRVLAYTIKPVIFVSIAMRICRNPNMYSLITGAGSVVSAQGLVQKSISRFIRMLTRFALAENAAVIFQNNDDRELFGSLGLLRKGTGIGAINGSGVDIDHYSVVPIPESPSFLMIARLLVDKGVREYAAAAEIVKRRFPDCRINLVGWIDSHPKSIKAQELQQWIDRGAINFLGYLDDVRSAIASCTVYVLPSYREGTPRTCLEAMSMGRAIITTDTPGCRETVIDGENGFLVPPRDARALARSMLRFLEKGCSYTKMGRRSRQIAEEKYDVRIVNQQLFDIMHV